jgi:magnesium chelatase family protein
MDFSIIHSRALSGIQAPAVTVETHLSNGLPKFTVVGLPETAVREARERVRSALINSHFEFPSDRHITINLAPADLPKEGGRFDLPIALGILVASGQLPQQRLLHSECIGELALNGDLRAVPGGIGAAIAASASNRQLILPAANADQAACVPGSQVIGANDLLTLCAHLNGNHTLQPLQARTPCHQVDYPDMADVVGQPGARRALEIAAAGAHHLLCFGPPGTGKTLLASRLPGILPPPQGEEALTSLAIVSASGSTTSSTAVVNRNPKISNSLNRAQ